MRNFDDPYPGFKISSLQKLLRTVEILKTFRWKARREFYDRY